MTTTPVPHADTAAPAAGVRFVELAGADAPARLAPLAAALRAGGARVELLASLDRDDLWLLVARGGAAVAGGDTDDAPVPPAGARTWRFRSVAS